MVLKRVVLRTWHTLIDIAVSGHDDVGSGGRYYVEHGWNKRVHGYSNEIHLLLQLHVHSRFNIYKHTHTHTHIHTYLVTCGMLTTVTGCLCVLQGALRQPFERLDPVLDRINEAIDKSVSAGKCVSSRERCVWNTGGPMKQLTYLLVC